MISSKFGIGQPIRHKLLGFPGVIIDIDPEYSLETPTWEEISGDDTPRSEPWYHVVMEDDKGQSIHTYLAEAQLMQEELSAYEHPSLNELAEVIQRRTPQLRH
ncbi:heat shock protein HspQ [Pectobacterium fontis]|uniref:Heat shock protein HspQ n=1 Tax=Pectobacterium fontis TaxID=2558042 RepID=A0A7V8IGD5_9GAMM|nr:heat shock protein HspQ [Pectobacterium fontis]KHN49817.1 heat shock protein HspQ [Pectobacterium fontis]